MYTVHRLERYKEYLEKNKYIFMDRLLDRMIDRKIIGMYTYYILCIGKYRKIDIYVD